MLCSPRMARTRRSIAGAKAYQREGVDLDVSTLTGWVGACAAIRMPLVDAIRKHVVAAERIHADGTTVPVPAQGPLQLSLSLRNRRR
jgi:transposase